jgi:hypothetical protein
VPDGGLACTTPFPTARTTATAKTTARIRLDNVFNFTVYLLLFVCGRFETPIDKTDTLDNASRSRRTTSRLANDKNESISLDTSDIISFAIPVAK